MERIRIYTYVLLVLALLAATWYLVPPTEPDGATDTTVLKRGNGLDPGSLDPALAEDVHAFNVLSDIYEGLTAESADGSLIPGVAKSWQFNEEGTQYEFTLRSDAYWSNGDPVTAADYVRAFRRVASPSIPSTYGFLLESIQGYADVKAGTKEPQALGIEAIGPYTLFVRLNRPTPYFLSLLAMPVAFPVHADMFPDDTSRRPTEHISNGPYRLHQRAPNGPITLRRNVHYWDRQSISFDEVIYYPISDTNAELNMYRSGELDITYTIPPSHIQQLRESVPGEVRIAPTLALYYLAFDLTETPLDNLELRKALSKAIDRDHLVAVIGRGERPAYSVVPPGVANHAGVDYDWREVDAATRIAQARRHFAAAGYGPDNPLAITLAYDAGDIHQTVATAVSSMWSEFLDVEVNAAKMEWKLLLDTRHERPAWDIMRFSWVGDYNDPMTFAEIFYSDSPQNLAQYANPKYDDLLDRAAVETDSTVRKRLMAESEALLIDDYPVIPLYFYVNKHLVKPHIEGFEDNVLDRHASRYLSKASDKR